MNKQNPNFSIKVDAGPYKNSSFAFSFHDDLEITLTLSDGGVYFVGEKIYPIRYGHLFVFNSTDLHRSNPQNEHGSAQTGVYHRGVLHFRPEILEGLASDTYSLLECFVDRGENFSHCLPLTVEQTEYILSLYHKAAKAYNEKVRGYDIIFKLVLAEILLIINPLYQQNTNQEFPQTSEYFTKVQPIIRYIQDNLAEPLCLDDLALQFFISKYHLCWLFKKATGFTVMEYIIHRRVLAARRLLKEGYSVQAAGETAGFNNNAHFIRTFGHLVGVSPGKYKKLNALTEQPRLNYNRPVKSARSTGGLHKP